MSCNQHIFQGIFVISWVKSVRDSSKGFWNSKVASYSCLEKCMPTKDKGGLSMRSRRGINKNLIMKVCWHLYLRKDYLWVVVVKGKYKCNSDLVLMAPKSQSASYFLWRSRLEDRWWINDLVLEKPLIAILLLATCFNPGNWNPILVRIVIKWLRRKSSVDTNPIGHI